MKKLIVVLWLVFMSLGSCFAETVQDPVVDVEKVKEFGLWRIYNTGSSIYVVDSRGGAYLRDAEGDDWIVSTTQKRRYTLRGDGTGYDWGIYGPDDVRNQTANSALAIAPSAHLLDGVYGVGTRRYRVAGDTLTIYAFTNYDIALGRALPQVTLKAYSNAMLHQGTETQTYIDPTVNIGPGDIPGPARILGDCAATYNPETSKITIPCLRAVNNTTVYEVDLNQVPGTLNFSVDASTLKPVQ